MKLKQTSTFRSLFSQGSGLFLLLIFIIWLQLTIACLHYGKQESLLLINGFHIKLLDHLLFWLSQISGGYIITSIVVMILARSYPVQALTAMMTSFVAWYVCITIQYNHFPDWKSPSALLGPKLHLLSNPNAQPELNFPSAQAAIVTGLGVYLSWLFSDKFKYALLLFVVTLILLYSRIYVGWSFPNDVLLGSVLGTISGIFCIVWLPGRLSSWYDRRTLWWQDLIIAILRAAAICTIFVNIKNFML